jgi:hypothetical protein
MTLTEKLNSLAKTTQVVAQNFQEAQKWAQQALQYAQSYDAYAKNFKAATFTDDELKRIQDMDIANISLTSSSFVGQGGIETLSDINKKKALFDNQAREAQNALDNITNTAKDIDTVNNVIISALRGETGAYGTLSQMSKETIENLGSHVLFADTGANGFAISIIKQALQDLAFKYSETPQNQRSTNTVTVRLMAPEGGLAAPITLENDAAVQQFIAILQSAGLRAI